MSVPFAFEKKLVLHKQPIVILIDAFRHLIFVKKYYFEALFKPSLAEEAIPYDVSSFLFSVLISILFTPSASFSAAPYSWEMHSAFTDAFRRLRTHGSPQKNIKFFNVLEWESEIAYYRRCHRTLNQALSSYS